MFPHEGRLILETRSNVGHVAVHDQGVSEKQVTLQINKGSDNIYSDVGHVTIHNQGVSTENITFPINKGSDNLDRFKYALIFNLPITNDFLCNDHFYARSHHQ